MAETKPKTISVPVDLHADLARFPEENWSKVACLAFTIRVKELEAMSVTAPREKAIARLKASKLRRESELESKGRAAGAEYALEYAEIDELQRLQRFSIEPGLLENADDLARILVEGDNWDGVRDTANDLREEHGEAADDPGWMHAFVAGAVEEFDKIEKDI